MYKLSTIKSPRTSVAGIICLIACLILLVSVLALFVPEIGHLFWKMRNLQISVANLLLGIGCAYGFLSARDHVVTSEAAGIMENEN